VAKRSESAAAALRVTVPVVWAMECR
jgi:hypothetical protein